MKFLQAFHPLKAKGLTRFQLLLVAIFLAKVAISAVSLSFDTGAKASELMAESIVVRSSPWGLLNWLMYRFWLLIPIDRSHLFSNPDTLATPAIASTSLLLILKLPAIFLDALIASALYWHAKLAVSAKIGRGVLVVWLANPFTTLTIEMLGSVAILSTSLFFLALLVFAHRRGVLSAALVAATLAIQPILVLAVSAMWIWLARARRWKMLLLHVLCAVAGLGAFVRWSTDLGLDPYRLVRIENQFSLALADFFADPFVLFGVGIGLGTTIAIAYVLYTYVVYDANVWSVFDAAYGTVAILFAFSTWNFTILLIILPYLCLLMKDGLSRMMPKAALLLIALLPVWALLSGNPQLLKLEAISFAQLGSRHLQSLLNGDVGSFLLRPFVRGLVLVALLIVAFGSSSFHNAVNPSGNEP